MSDVGGRRINDTFDSVCSHNFLEFSIDNYNIYHYAPSYRLKYEQCTERPTPITLVRYSEIVRRKGGEGDVRHVKGKVCPV